MPTAARATRRFLASERGFTLIELLITVSIIAIMASMLLFALYNAQESAKAAKTRALIAKLDAIIRGKWESYQTRRVPIVIPPGTSPWAAAKARLDGLRDLMRMELPERYSDIADVDASGPVPVIKRPYAFAMPTTGVPPSSVLQGYFRRVTAANLADPSKPSIKFQGAECLYLIVMAALQEEGDSREVFKADTIGDVDGDGMPEFLDGWGHPIQFLRWAPGFGSQGDVMAHGEVGTASGSDPVLLQVVPTSASRFSTLPGHYVGGVLAGWDASRDAPNQDSAARITGYSYDPSTNIATFSFAKLGGFPPFPTGSPSGEVVILAPDPFDPMGVFPIFPKPSPGSPLPDFSIPTYAIYPLIYSAGGDGCYCVRSELFEPSPTWGLNPDYPLNYRGPSVAMNPYYAPSNKQMMGTQLGVTDTPEREPTTEPFYSKGGSWRDNIHNHAQGLK